MVCIVVGIVGDIVVWIKLGIVVGIFVVLK